MQRDEVHERTAFTRQLRQLSRMLGAVVHAAQHDVLERDATIEHLRRLDHIGERILDVDRHERPSQLISRRMNRDGKAHRSAQPACDEMQSVTRLPSGIATVSIASPSLRRKRNFCVPSTDFWRTTNSSRGNANAESSSLRSAAGNSVIASNDAAGFCQRRRKTWRTRYSGSPTSDMNVDKRASASSGVRSSRFSRGVMAMSAQEWRSRKGTGSSR